MNNNINIYGKLVNDTDKGILVEAGQVFDGNESQSSINTSVKNDIDDINKDIDYLNKDIDDINKDIINIGGQINNLSGDISSINNQITTLNNNQNTLNTKANKNTNDISNLNNKYNNLTNSFTSTFKYDGGNLFEQIMMDKYIYNYISYIDPPSNSTAPSSGNKTLTVYVADMYLKKVLLEMKKNNISSRRVVVKMKQPWSNFDKFGVYIQDTTPKVNGVSNPHLYAVWTAGDSNPDYRINHLADGMWYFYIKKDTENLDSQTNPIAVYSNSSASGSYGAHPMSYTGYMYLDFFRSPSGYDDAVYIKFMDPI